MRLPIHLQREVARLHFHDPRQSHRALGRACGLSPGTVQAVRTALTRNGQPWSKLQALDDDAWRDSLGTRDRTVAQTKPAPDWQWVHAEMQRADATLQMLWHEWREQCPDGIGYSQFATGYRLWTKRLHVVMRRTHRPGDKLFVDFAGRTVEVRDPAGGPSQFAQVFLAVLGYSNLTYLEAVDSQSTADWIGCHVRCLRAIGGVPQWVVSDNLKAAVWRRERDRIVINAAYRDCLTHYDTAALPTGKRKPKHKAKVEVGVLIAQRWVLFALRDRVFFSMKELNDELARMMVRFNDHPFKKLPGCRRQRFEAGERAALKPLPALPFELRDWRYGVLVQDDHHVEHERCYYSVPSALARERVDLRFTQDLLEVFHRGRLVAVHALLKTAGEVSTVPEHRPLAHQRVLEGEPKQLMQWATRVGIHTRRMIEHHLRQRHDAVNGIRAAQRMRELARLYGEPRFEEVCAYALPLNITSLRSVTSILKEDVDRRAKVVASTAPRPPGQVRGASYFKEGS